MQQAAFFQLRSSRWLIIRTVAMMLRSQSRSALHSCCSRCQPEPSCDIALIRRIIPPTTLQRRCRPPVLAALLPLLLLLLLLLLLMMMWCYWRCFAAPLRQRRRGPRPHVSFIATMTGCSSSLFARCQQYGTLVAKAQMHYARLPFVDTAASIQ